MRDPLTYVPIQRAAAPAARAIHHQLSTSQTMQCPCVTPAAAHCKERCESLIHKQKEGIHDSLHSVIGEETPPAQHRNNSASHEAGAAQPCAQPCAVPNSCSYFHAISACCTRRQKGSHTGARHRVLQLQADACEGSSGPAGTAAPWSRDPPQPPRGICCDRFPTA